MDATPVDCLALPGGIVDATDCDDADGTVFPGAAELCDLLDNDCDGVVPPVETDDDGDGFSECADGDCDDASAAVYVGAPEVCNEVDDDCDGVVPTPESDDLDGDGAVACLDCDDTDSSVAPGLPEVCDGIDNNCDGNLSTGEDEDVDGDGALACGDCEDGDATVAPGLPELCDGIDNNCDGVLGLDERDLDGDGGLACAFDCDDNDASTDLDAPEVCDGVDNDCDGSLPADESDADGDGSVACADCDDTAPSIYPGAPTTPCDGVDTNCDGALEPIDLVDGDGDGSVLCFDCDDTAATVFPGAPGACDGLDTDCDGLPDDDEVDDDGDGFDECSGDCDDTEPASAPGSTELCDGIDNDCDGVVPGNETVDADGDGVAICADCDDADPLQLDGSVELCDGFDNDCDGLTPGEGDLDGDGALDCDLFAWASTWARLTWTDMEPVLLPTSLWSTLSCATYSGSGTPAITTPFASNPWAGGGPGTATRTFVGPCSGPAGSSVQGALTVEDYQYGGSCPVNGSSASLPFPNPGEVRAVSGTGLTLVEPGGGPLSWDGGASGSSRCDGVLQNAVVVEENATTNFNIDAVVDPQALFTPALGGGEHALDFVHNTAFTVHGAPTGAYWDSGWEYQESFSGDIAATGGPQAIWFYYEYTGEFLCGGAPCPQAPAYCALEPMSGWLVVGVRDAAGNQLQSQTLQFDGATDCDGRADWFVAGVANGQLVLPAPF